MSFIRACYFTLFLVLLLLSSLRSAHASGLDLTLLYGTRYVGMGGQQVALANDAYAPFYNPAGLMGVEKFVLAANYSNLLTQYGAPIGADNAQRKGDLNLGPLFYLGAGYRLTERIVFGLGVYPTALQGGKFSNVDYSNNLSNREFSNRLVRIEFAPSLALKLIGPLSLGLSWRLGYTNLQNKAGAFNFAYIDSEMSAWDAKGFKVGFFLDDFYRFSAALTYRFRQEVNLKGTTTTTLDSAPNSPISQPTSQSLDIPSQLQFGIAYEILTDRLVAAFSYEYTVNSVIRNATITDRNTGAVVSSVPLDYSDGHTFHLGGEYTFHLDGQTDLKTQLGFAYDKAVTKAALPNPVLAPAEDYIGFAVGSQYELSKSDLLHIFGLAFNYGEYSSRTNNLDSRLTSSGVQSVFLGKYSLRSFMIVADYQLKF